MEERVISKLISEFDSEELEEILSIMPKVYEEFKDIKKGQGES